MPAAKDWTLFASTFVKLGGTLQWPNGKATAAAKACGYKDPQKSASRLLQRPDVRQLINDLVQASIAKGIDQIPSANEIMLAIATIAKDDKLFPSVRLRALEDLAKYHGLFMDKIQIDTPNHVMVKGADGTVLLDVHG